MTTLPALGATVRGMARFIHAHASPTRRDRLWPGHSSVFATNPLNLAYGAGGIALFLNEVEGGVDAEVRAWMLSHRLTTDAYPPGLWCGLAGIAYAFAELGWMEEGEAAMRLAATSPLRFADPTLIHGAAGYGWANLYFADRTGNDAYLDRAEEAAAHLLATAGRADGLPTWTHALDDRVHYGFAFGGSGIALFLLELARRTGDPATLAAARDALEFDLVHGTTEDGGWDWRRWEGDTFMEPYWLHGGAGVATAVVRFAEHLGDARYRRIADEIARTLHVQFTIMPSQWEGMSGIGEVLLDAARLTGDDAHLEAARLLSRSILLYRIERPDGVAFPGYRIQRLSTDVATGSAGIGLFLHRLHTGGRRLFADLPGRAASMQAVHEPVHEAIAVGAD